MAGAQARIWSSHDYTPDIVATDMGEERFGSVMSLAVAGGVLIQDSGLMSLARFFGLTVRFGR